MLVELDFWSKCPTKLYELINVIQNQVLQGSYTVVVIIIMMMNWLITIMLLVTVGTVAHQQDIT